MSTTLASMVLELSANVAQFQSDLGRAAAIAQQQADKIKGIFASVGGALGVGLGVDAFKDFIEGSIEAQDQALKFAQKVGISTDAVAGLSSAAAKAGVDQQGLQQALVKLSVGASDAANGVTKYATAYNALGINVKDANGNVKAADVLLGEIADKFKSYADGTAKTADAVLLFGKAGAQMIPLLNGGSAAIQKQTQLAKDLGAAISEEAAKAAEEFNEKLKDLGLVSQGLGNQISQALLPALNSLADAAIKFFTSDTWKSWLQSVGAAFKTLADNLDTIIASVKLLGEIAVDYIGARMVASLVAATARMVALTAATIAANSAAAEMGISWNGGVLASIKQIGFLNAAIGGIAAGIAGWQIGTYLYKEFSVVQTIANNTVAIFDAAWTLVSAGAQIILLEMQKAFYFTLDAISGYLSDKVASWGASFAKLPAALGGAQISAQFLALAAAIAPAGTKVADLDAKIATLGADTTKNLAIINKTWGENNAATEGAASATDHVSEAAQKAAPNLAGLGNAADKAAKAAIALANAELGAQKFLDGIASSMGGPYEKAFEQYSAAIAEASKQANALTAAHEPLAKVQQFLAEATQLATQRFQEQTDAGLLLRKTIDDLTQKENLQLATAGLSADQAAIITAKMQAQDLIAKALTNTMGPLTQADQDTADATIALAGHVAELTNGLKLNQVAAQDWVNIWKTAGDGVATTFAKILVEGGSLFDGLKSLAMQTVEAIISYFAKLAVINPILNSIFGGGGLGSSGFSALPTLSNFGGVGSAGGLSGLFSPGGLFGGGQELAGPPVEGATSAGVSGGLNFGAIGAAFGGALAGYQAAGPAGALALGTAAYFIPVVGWIAGAASLINSLTGGGLFGTNYKPTGQTSFDLGVGSSGASVQDYLQESKKGALFGLFGGNSTKNVSVTAPQSQIDQANALYASLSSTNQAAATALGESVQSIITGSFKQVTDKSGNITSQISTILGKTYSEPLADFEARLEAVNLLAQADAAAGASAASDIAAKYAANAQTFLASAQMLVAAQVDIQHGMGLLGSDSTLSGIDAIVSKLAVSGESLVQAYTRLQSEQLTLAASLSAMGLSVGKTGADFVTFADQLATAAGGLSNLSTLWSNYYTEFYSDAERAANNTAALQKSLVTQGAAIGESASESLAQFRADFTAALPNLSADQVIAWLKFGDTLYQASTAAATAAQNYAAFIAPFTRATDGLDTFEHSMLDLGTTLQANIDQANALARAQGLQGASAQDIAKIIEVSAQQGAAALQQLQAQGQQLAASLYGSSYIASLQAQIPNQSWLDNTAQNKIADAQAAQAAATTQSASRYSSATQIAQIASEIAATGGGNIKDVLFNLGAPISGLADDLHLQGQALTDYLNKLVDTDKVSLQIADNTGSASKLLQDILDSLNSRPLTFGPGDFGDTASPPSSLAGVNLKAPNVTPNVRTLPAPDAAPAADPVAALNTAVDSVANAIDTNSADVKNGLADVARALGKLEQTMTRFGMARGVTA